MASIAERIAIKTGVPDLVHILGERLSLADLQSLLHEVYKAQAARRTPAQVATEYVRSRLFGPGLASAAELLDLRSLAAECCRSFEMLDLSPAAPLGTTSSVAPISPDWSIAALHAAEVVSDPTNVLALEAAYRRKAGQADVSLGTIQRVVRPQRYSDPDALGHFTLLALATAGRDRGNFAFEAEALARHLDAHLSLVARYFGDEAVVRVTYSTGENTAHQDARVAAVQTTARRHGAAVAEEPGRDVIAYYKGFCFHVFIGETQLSDGGIVDWSQQFLANAKERLLISGMGLEFLPRLRDIAAD